MADFVRIRDDDSVAVALRPLAAGQVLQVGAQAVTLRADIPQGHKFAACLVPAGAPVIKYGCPIGTAGADILPGSWVHTHNLHTALAQQQTYSYSPALPVLPPLSSAPFRGFLRADGRAGVRNELWVLPTVGCVNDVCTRLAQDAGNADWARGLDGVYAFTHPYGCSQMGEDHAATRKLLAALARHPNAGGVLVVGLGCENLTMQQFKEELGAWDGNRVKYMVCQDEADERETGLALLRQLAGFARTFRRQALPMRMLTVGMKCGGSDGLSGITANAVAGAFSDRLVAMGGSTILTEVPEMFGAEQLLMNRCVSERVFDDMVRMVDGFKDYYVSHHLPVYENPSPGNKDGGITTLEDKSLGCVQKGGTAPIVDVLDYGGAVKTQGLNVLCGPGNDLVSATALTAAGAQVILFTTGRGTPFGAPAVTLKIASNSALAAHKPNWIDFNAGTVAEGEAIADAAARLMDLVLAVACGGACSKAEENGYREIAIFKNGVTL